MERTRLTLLLVLALACSTCGSNSGGTGVLPGDQQIGTWKIVGGPFLAKTDVDLYSQIDGAAPKYIERGWVSSAYATYQKDGSGTSIQVAVHDMGTPENAESMFNVYLPATRTNISYIDESDPAGRRPNAIVDMSLASAFAARGFGNRYYLEASIDARTDAVLADLKVFMLELVDRAQHESKVALQRSTHGTRRERGFLNSRKLALNVAGKSALGSEHRPDEPANYLR